jgi:UDPglucose--hexose-1-phosphate uridylyltransferase
VPFWAVWPFETYILPKNPERNRQLRRLTDLNEAEETSLADVMKRLLTKYDNLFQCSFPYTMGFHGEYTESTSNA